MVSLLEVGASSRRGESPAVPWRFDRCSTDSGRARKTRTFLMPIHQEEPSPVLLGQAVRLAQESAGTLLLMQAVQLNIAGEERGIRRLSLLEELLHEAERRLMRLAESLRPRVPTDVVVCEGAPAKAIVEMAGTTGADAIVLQRPARRGWLGWRGWLRHDSIRSVVRQAPCAVYLIGQSEDGVAAE